MRGPSLVSVPKDCTDELIQHIMMNNIDLSEFYSPHPRPFIRKKEVLAEFIGRKDRQSHQLDSYSARKSSTGLEASPQQQPTLISYFSPELSPAIGFRVRSAEIPCNVATLLRCCAERGIAAHPCEGDDSYR